MKKRIVSLIVLTSLVLASCVGCGKSNTQMKKVTLNEVAHSIFYAPMYVAIEKGYFAEEGLEINLVNGAGADNVMTAVLSGQADIGFMGSEASIYVLNEGKEDYIVNFSQLTQRAGNFLVGKQADASFSWDKLKGKTVLGGRDGGMPEMVFEYILKKNGIDPVKDLTIVKNIKFGLTAQAFASGNGDYTVEFEPFAAGLEEEGKGTVIASLGEASGMVPYTAFSAKKSYLEKNGDTIQAFTNAIQKGMDFVQENEPDTIAKAIAPQFKETPVAKISTIVKRYKDQDTWKKDTVFTEDAFNLLGDILKQAAVIKEVPSYEKLVNTQFAEKAAK